MFLQKAAQSFKSLFPRQASQSFGAFVNHRDTPNNLEETPFEFTQDNYTHIKELMARYPDNYKHSACLPMLTLAQKQNDNFLTLSAMNKVAKVLEMEPMQVYEVASFYTMYNRTRLGKFHLQVCGTTPCMVRGAEKVMEAMRDHLGVGMDEMTADGLFTISEVECLGACVNAPMVQVNNEWFYEDLDAENTVQLLDDLKNGVEKKGPQIDRNFSEGPLGRTSLKDHSAYESHHDRDFDGELASYTEAKEKAAAEAAAKKAAAK